MIDVGDVAPDFTLPGWHEGEIKQFTLSDYTETGAVLLGVYVFDFSEVCSAQMCQVTDMNWYEYKNDLTIFGVSRDGPFSHKKFAEEEGIGYPLLCDTSGEMLGSYGLLMEEGEGFRQVPRRSVLLIDSDRTVRYKWVAEDNWQESAFDFNPVQEAIKAL